MKVLGIAEKDYSKVKYIVEITATELQHIFKYEYGKVDYKAMENLEQGRVLNLSLVHNYYDSICSLFNDMKDTIDKFEKTKDIIYNFSRIFGPEVKNEKDS